MDQKATELREAAASARAFADSVGSPELKRSFKDMARRWEKEADERELEELRSTAARHAWSFDKASLSRKH